MNDMVEVVIDSIRVGLMSQNRVIILREVDSDRFLAIWIDPYMAEQITFALQEVEVARPMSHDLLKQVLQNLNARLLRVEVLELKNEVFYGNLVVETDSGHTLNIALAPFGCLSPRSARQCANPCRQQGDGRRRDHPRRRYQLPR